MKICIYSTFFTKEFPPYVIAYVNELSNHFDLTVVTYATNHNEPIDFFVTKNVRFVNVQNEGLDFGMWMKSFLLHQNLQPTILCLANDSCALIKSLDAIMNAFYISDVDLYGATQSPEQTHHIQSYFLLLRPLAIHALSTLFATNGIVNSYDSIVSTYEVGLSKAVRSMGGKIDAFTLNGYNRPLMDAKALIIEQIPMVKRFHINQSYKPGIEASLTKFNAMVELDFILQHCDDAFKKPIEELSCHH